MKDSEDLMVNGLKDDSPIEDAGFEASGIGAHNLGDLDYSSELPEVPLNEETVEEILAIPVTPVAIFDMSKLVADKEYQYRGTGFSHKLPTGFAPFDVALGGGIPLGGAIIEIFGEESAGKTTLTYRICKRVTDTGGYITWLDNESSYDDGWAMVQGLDVDRVIPYRPPYMEKAIEIILEDIKMYKDKFLPWLNDKKWKPSKEQASLAGLGVTKIEEIKKYMKESAPSHIIAWDTLAQCPLKTVVEGEEFGGGMALRARMIKSFLSRYQVGVEGCEKVSMILLNQVIDNIGNKWEPITTPGGRGLRHAKHLSIFVKKAGPGVKDAQNFQDTEYVILSIVKNKVTPIIGSFPIIFSKSKGYMGATSTLEYLFITKWFTDSGSWKKFTYTKIDPETGEIIEEPMNIQRGTYYDLIDRRPEIEDFLVQTIKDQFTKKFPFSQALLDTDIDNIMESARREGSYMPDESEVIEMDKKK